MRDSRSFSGNFLIDDDVLREEGMTDFSGYRCDPQAELTADISLLPKPC